MSLAPAVLSVLPALIFVTLRTAKAVGPTSGLVDDLRRQMIAAHPAPVATIPISYTKGRRS
jgi:hypothetical protein